MSTKPFLLLALLFSLRVDVYAGELSDGIAYYQKGNYEQALKSFQCQLAHDENNVAAHYYLATTCLKLQKKEQAIMEYQEVVRLAPTGAAGTYSQQALSTLMGASLSSPPSAAPEASSKSLKEPAKPQPVTEAADAGTSNSLDSGVGKSVAGIGAEINLRQAIIDKEASDRTLRLTSESAVRIKAIEADMTQDIALAGGSARQKASPGYAEYVQSVRDEYNKRIDVIKDETRRNIEAVMKECKEKKVALEDAALVLDRKYLDKSQSDHRLVPRLTNVYVQTYRTDAEASGAEVPILASPGSLNSEKMGPSKSHKSRSVAKSTSAMKSDSRI